MDLSLWQSLFEGERPPFCKTTIQLRGVTGQNMKTIGCVDVTIGQTIISVILVQTDDPTLFILGYDALNRLNATVDTTSHELIINGQRLSQCMNRDPVPGPSQADTDVTPPMEIDLLAAPKRAFQSPSDDLDHDEPPSKRSCPDLFISLVAAVLRSHHVFHLPHPRCYRAPVYMPPTTSPPLQHVSRATGFRQSCQGKMDSRFQP